MHAVALRNVIKLCNSDCVDGRGHIANHEFRCNLRECLRLFGNKGKEKVAKVTRFK